MDKFNIILIVLIFTSLVIIIGIFGKNLKNFKQAEKSLRLRGDVGRKEEQKKGFSFGFLWSKFSDFFVWIAETIIGSAGKALKAAHSGLLEMKAKRKSMGDSQAPFVKIDKNTESLAGDVIEKKSKNKLSNLKSRFSRDTKNISNRDHFFVVQENKKEKSNDNFTREVDIVEKDNKDNKVKDFFQKPMASVRKESLSQNISTNDYYEQEENLEVAEKKETEKEENISKKGFFNKINPFKKEEIVGKRKILTEESFNEFSDGVTVVKKDFSAKEEDVYMKDVVRARQVSQRDINDDDDLGVDRKILEKRILQKIATNPKDIEGYRQLGELYIKMENFDDAYSAYKFILKISARDVDASRKLEKIKLLKRLK